MAWRYMDPTTSFTSREHASIRPYPHETRLKRARWRRVWPRAPRRRRESGLPLSVGPEGIRTPTHTTLACGLDRQATSPLRCEGLDLAGDQRAPESARSAISRFARRAPWHMRASSWRGYVTLMVVLPPL